MYRLSFILSKTRHVLFVNTFLKTIWKYSISFQISYLQGKMRGMSLGGGSDSDIFDIGTNITKYPEIFVAKQ